MDGRTPMKVTFDGLAVLLVSSGMTLATTAETTERMAVGVILIVLGIISYIVRHTWNNKMLETKYGNGNDEKEKEEYKEDVEENLEEEKPEEEKPEEDSKKEDSKKEDKVDDDKDFWKDVKKDKKKGKKKGKKKK